MLPVAAYQRHCPTARILRGTQKYPSVEDGCLNAAYSTSFVPPLLPSTYLDPEWRPL